MKKNILRKWKIGLALIPLGVLALIFSLGIPGEKVPLVVVIVDDKPVVPEQMIPGKPEEINVALQKNNATAIASSYYIDPKDPDRYAPWHAIDGIKGIINDYVWSSPELMPWIQIDFDKPYDLHIVIIYDRPNEADTQTAILMFSDGSSIDIGQGTSYPIYPDGSASIIELDEPKLGISWIKVQVTSNTAIEGNNPGLSEIEAFSYIQQPNTIIPAQSLYTQTKDKVEEYCQALADDGYVVVLHRMKEAEDCKALRKYLQDMYNNPELSNDDTLFGAEDLSNAKLNGAISIGNVPGAFFQVDEVDEGGVFPVDLYYMSLDSEWVETNLVFDENNNITYSPVFVDHTGDIKPEIWFSRIRPYYPEDLYNAFVFVTSYLDKNLQFRADLKNGVLMDGNALLITNDSQAYILTPGMRCLYKNSAISDVKYNIDSDYFMALISGLDGTTYDFMDINTGSLYTGGLYFEERFTPSYYIDPFPAYESTSKFVLSRTPGFANYILYECPAISLTSGDSDAICVLGYSSIRPHPQHFSYDSFYYNAAKPGVSVGDAFKEGICKAIIDYKMGAKTKYCDQAMGALLDKVAHGFTIYGDPTFRLASVLSPDKKGSGQEAKSYLAKGITGGDFSKPDIIPNNINFVKEGNNLVIYIDWIYETPAVVNVSIASDGFFTTNNKYTTIASWYGKVKIDNQLAQYFKFAPAKSGVSHRNSIKFLPSAKLPLDNKIHRVEITLDATNNVLERNENNNKISERFYCGYKLDLKPTKMDFVKGDSFYKDDDVPTWYNDYMNLRIQIENNGLIPTNINLFGTEITEGKTSLKVYAGNKNGDSTMLTNQEVKFQYNDLVQYPRGYIERYLGIGHVVLNTNSIMDPDDSKPPSFTFKSIVDGKNTLKKYLKLPM